MKQHRTQIAKETLEIIEKGRYAVQEKVIDFRNQHDTSVAETEIISPDTAAFNEVKSKRFNTHFEVVNETTLAGARALVHSTGQPVGILNFASAKNPGGGFMGEAQAQEESIARSSTLYPTLLEGKEMYDFNRSRRTYLYSDYMIYSPGVTVFRDDHLLLLPEPYQVDVLTSPAVNVGAILNNNPAEFGLLKSTMLQRMDKLLGVFAERNRHHLVLGAWGCGVFRNDPTDVAMWFSSLLQDGGKYDGVFQHVRFSVLDTRNAGTFEAFLNKFG